MSKVIGRQANQKQYYFKYKKFIDLIKEDGFVRFLIYLQTLPIALISLIIIFVTSSVSVYQNSLILFFSSTCISFFVGLYILFSKNSTNEITATTIVPNKRGYEYMLNMGVEVKEHLGDAIKSLIPENLTGNKMLISTETVKRAMAVIGKPGSGKTVLLKGMFEQQLALGGGAFVIDAKGTVDEIKRFMALVYKYGREDDLYILNFGNMNNTHTINFLAYGNPLNLKEIMMTLASSTEAKWKQVDEDYIESLLKLCVYKRDYEDVVLTLEEMRNYMSLSSLLKQAWRYKNTSHTYLIDFVRYVCSKLEIDYQDFINADPKDKNFYDECVKKSQNSQLQGVYEAGLAQGNWNGILTVLGSNYGNIFNVKDPDINLFECVQNNKIVLVSLPTLDSEETAKKIGKVLLGIIKGVGAEKAKGAREPKIPFLLLLDEIGAFCIQGFGRFMSQARALGMSMVLFFQSIAQLDVVDDGKGLERKEILDMCSTFTCLKNNDYELAEHLSKTVKKDVILEMNYKENRYNAKSKDDLSKELDYTIKEEDRLKSEFMAKMNNGEMFFVAEDEAFKCVATAPSDFNLTYKEKVVGNQLELPLLQVYPVKKLLNDLKSRKAQIFVKDYIYLEKADFIARELEKKLKRLA